VGHICTRLILLCSLGILATAWNSSAAATSATQSPGTRATESGAKDRLAGTWRLATVERLGAKDELLPALAPPAMGSPNPIGVLVYDRAGFMAVTIMQSGRQKYAGATPTPDEAKAALLSYTSYFGTFSVNDADGIVTHHVQGSLNPNNTGTDQKRSFELTGNRLTLKPPRASTGIQLRLTWERVPELQTLTPTHRRLIGFWKQVSSDRRAFDGTLLRSTPPRIGFLIFTSAGHMAVHLMDPGRKKYRASEPTPQEAQAALNTYGSAYFGPYAINEAERYEVTRQIGTIIQSQVGANAQRHLEFVGDNRVILKPPPELVDGQFAQGYVTWERVTPAPASRR
jgi:hypothetical protein